MQKAIYSSPLGKILLAAQDDILCGLWFEGQKYFPADTDAMHFGPSAVLSDAAGWLDSYFAGARPDIGDLKLMHPATEFRRRVTQIMLSIPYGQTVTYGDIAREIYGSANVACRAVGSAVGHNSISIIVPCHRVIGTDGSLHGYAGGLDRKRFLLELEGIVKK